MRAVRVDATGHPGMRKATAILLGAAAFQIVTACIDARSRDIGDVLRLLLFICVLQFLASNVSGGRVGARRARHVADERFAHVARRPVALTLRGSQSGSRTARRRRPSKTSRERRRFRRIGNLGARGGVLCPDQHALEEALGNLFTYAVVFLVVALVAAALGFGGVAGTAMEGARILFWVAIILFVISLVAGLVRRGNPRV